MVDAASGEATAEAKADGPLEQVFELQDRIVSQFADALGLATKQPRSLGDTSSLEAYRAFTEGRVRLESLDASQVPAAIADFEKAMELDPRYAAAHVGLANARFWQYEMSRARNQPDAGLLARAVDHVRRAIELERDLADAHATLVVPADERRGERRRRWPRRVEPSRSSRATGATSSAWRTRRGARSGCRRWHARRDLYQDFPFVHFEMAMVHIARGHLERAEPVLREGTVVQDRQADRKQRYPAKGLHWLLGLVRLACSDPGEALVEFEREIGSGSWQLYGPEFAMNAHDGAGFTYLTRHEPDAAVEAFRKALALFPDHARSLVGLGAALAAAGDVDGSQAALAKAATAIEALRRGGRSSESTDGRSDVRGRPRRRRTRIRNAARPPRQA